MNYHLTSLIGNFYCPYYTQLSTMIDCRRHLNVQRSTPRTVQVILMQYGRGIGNKQPSYDAAQLCLDLETAPSLMQPTSCFRVASKQYTSIVGDNQRRETRDHTNFSIRQIESTDFTANPLLDLRHAQAVRPRHHPTRATPAQRDHLQWHRRDRVGLGDRDTR